jgi:hypothetical protein
MKDEIRILSIEIVEGTPKVIMCKPKGIGSIPKALERDPLPEGDHKPNSMFSMICYFGGTPSRGGDGRMGLLTQDETLDYDFLDLPSLSQNHDLMFPTMIQFLNLDPFFLVSFIRFSESCYIFLNLDLFLRSS